MPVARLAVVVALAGTLAACSSDSGPSQAAPAADDDADVTVEMGEMFFDPDGIELPAGSGATLRLVNEGALRHNLVLPDGTESETLNAGDSTVMEIGPLAESVTAWCAIPGHRNAGMELQIDVVGN